MRLLNYLSLTAVIHRKSFKSIGILEKSLYWCSFKAPDGRMDTFFFCLRGPLRIYGKPKIAKSNLCAKAMLSQPQAASKNAKAACLLVDTNMLQQRKHNLRTIAGEYS